MARKRSLTIEILADEKGAIRGMQSLNQETQTTGEKFAQAHKKASMWALGIAGAGLLASKAILDHGAVMAANERKVETVFGSMAGSVRAWASENAEKMGQSENSVLGLAAAMGDLLIPMGFTRAEAAKMSMESLEVADALSAWTGGQLDTAAAGQVLTKAMLGEREELKQLGISIMDADVQQRLMEKGQKQLTGQALQMAKAVATQELVFERAADAISAYATDADPAYVAQQKLNAVTMELKDSLTQGLLPAVVSGAGHFADAAKGAQLVVEWFENLDEGTKQLAAAIPAVGVALLALSGHPVIAGLGLVATALALVGKNASASDDQVSGMIDAFSGLEDASLEMQVLASLGEAGTRVMNNLGLSTDDLIARWQNGTLASAEFNAEILEMSKGSAQAQSEAHILTDRLEHLAAQLTEASLAAQAQETQLWRTTAAETGYIDVVNAASTVLSGPALAAVKGYTGAQGDQEDATDDATGALENQIDTHRAMTDPVFAAIKASEELTGAQREYRDALRATGPDSKRSRDALADMTTKTHNAEAAAIDLNSADLGDFRNELVRSQVAAGATASEAGRVADRIIAHVGRINNASLRDKAAVWRIRVETSDHVGRRPGGGRQHGGPVTGGEVYEVGEAGPELFKAPVSGRIVPNHDLAAAASAPSASVVNNFALTVNAGLGTDGAALGRVVLEALQQLQRQNGALPLTVRGSG